MMNANAPIVGTKQPLVNEQVSETVDMHGKRHGIVHSVRKSKSLNDEQTDFVIPIINSVSSKHPEVHDSWEVRTYRDGSVSIGAGDAFKATYDIHNSIVYLEVSGSKSSILSCHS